ncbi:MAG: lysine--tRNA ligase [Candidatus Kerfeldbacteria bacterium]|nr:lysine--tRNA ligase [Candidatus Kerfeldbacteria bacterium]
MPKTHEQPINIPEERVREQKLADLRKILNPFPSKTFRSQTIATVLARFDVLKKRQKRVSIAGRVMAVRSHGGAVFYDVEDGTGKMQVFLKKDLLDPTLFELINNLIERGDLVEVRGICTLTKRGEKTILANTATLLSKALLPLPEKWHGLTDTEARFRKRHLDLIANPETRNHFIIRARVIRAIREFLDRHNFLEVETPILQIMAGGASARPFKTHHHALDMDLYLRVAPELFLKRLVVGGFERVYEIARCFRNEGMDYSHNPEFTQVEFYYAYQDYEGLMKFTEQLLEHVLMKTMDTLEISYEGKPLSFRAPFPRKTFHDAVLAYAGVDLDLTRNQKDLFAEAVKLNVDVDASMHWGKLADEIFKTCVRPQLISPTFIIDYPIELSPLAKKKESDPRYVERFQLIAAGVFELCNAFSELNDPEDQEQRFQAQDKLARAGDKEAQPYDRDYVEALKTGMPPTAGLGMGIDRFVMLLTNQHSIKEVLLFPTMRPE